MTQLFAVWSNDTVLLFNGAEGWAKLRERYDNPQPGQAGVVLAAAKDKAHARALYAKHVASGRKLSFPEVLT